MRTDKEPKASTEKASLKYWEKNKLALAKGTSLFALKEENKATYDLLVSLEAKIEELNALIIEFNDSAWKAWMDARKKKLEAEYQKLIEQHKLK